jgi:ABC-2 type transport system ATP-binding protein
MENILEVERLRKEYRGFTLKDVSFSVPYGYIMGLIGPNGAGKTTIIKLIMNLIGRDGGRIKIFGKDNLESEAEVKSRIGFVYDTPCFPEDATLSDIGKSVGLFYPKWDGRLFGALISEFELPLKKKFKKLSHGMQTKFALALALAHDADFILMDEPTAGLDPVFRRELLSRLSGLLQDERKSILFSTHITTDLERIADYITFVHDGELILSSTKEDLLENWGVVKGGRELLAEGAGQFFHRSRTGEFGVEALTSDVNEVRRRFESGVIIQKATLQDIMFFTDRGDRHV